VRLRHAENVYHSIYGKQQLSTFMNEQPTRERPQLQSNLEMG
jgi:hypothetical protein